MGLASVRSRIAALVIALAAVAIAVAWYAIDTMQTYNAYVRQMNLASQRALLAERINGQINAVVMDSRGVYMAASTAEAVRYGDGLLKTLADMSKNREQLIASYQNQPTNDLKTLADGIQSFDGFRRELVRLSRTGEPNAIRVARDFGDNDVNRSNRQALNQAMVAYAAATFKQVADSEAALQQHYDTRLTVIIAGSALAILLAAAFAAWVATRGITRPLAALVNAMERLVNRDYDAVRPDSTRQDEFGVMARAVDVFKDNALTAQRLEVEAEENRSRLAAEAQRRADDEQARREQQMKAELDAKMAEERRQREAEEATRRLDMDRRAAEERSRVEAEGARKKAMQKLADDFEHMISGVVGKVATAANDLQSVAGAMRDIADRTAAKAQAASNATEDAVGSVRTVTGATEKLTGSIGGISDQATTASTVSRQAVDDAERTNTTIRGLSQAVDQIGEVVSLITSIASQTNLLALNATIEAARAGDAGKGFAVVAGEVKNLANQTAKATDEIGQQIAGVQSATREAVNAIVGIGEVIQRINDISLGIASAVNEQGMATRDIASSIDRVDHGTRLVLGEVAGVTQSANEAGEAAGRVLDASAGLSTQAGRLREEVQRFLAEIRGR